MIMNEKSLLLILEERCRSVRDLKSDAAFLEFMRTEIGNVLDNLTDVRTKKRHQQEENRKNGGFRHGKF